MKFSLVALIGAASAIQKSDIANANINSWVHDYVKPNVPGIPHDRSNDVMPAKGSYPPYGSAPWPASTDPTYKPTDGEKAEAMDKKNSEAVPVVSKEKAATMAADAAAGPKPTA